MKRKTQNYTNITLNNSKITKNDPKQSETWAGNL